MLPNELRQQLRPRYLALAQQEADRGQYRRHPDVSLRDEAEDVLRCLVGDANAECPDAALIRALNPFAARDRQVSEDAGRWLREVRLPKSK